MSIPEMWNQNLTGTLLGMFIDYNKNSESIYMHYRVEQVNKCCRKESEFSPWKKENINKEWEQIRLRLELSIIPY